MPGSWDVVASELVNGRGDLVGPLRTAVRRQSAPVLAAVKAAWLSVEVSSSRGGTARPDRSTGLRARISAATTLTVTSTGVRFSVNGARVDPRYGQALAWYVNGSGRRPWRHPIFGRRVRPSDWAQQKGQEVFFSTVSAHAPAYRSAVVSAMEEVASRW